jgi:chemotaxis-related protein WspD
MEKPATQSINDAVGRATEPGDRECWSKIGISGDRSCPELKTYVHCRNCPVFAAEARTFFDRSPPDGYLADWSHWLGESSRSELPNGHSTAHGAQAREKKLSFLIYVLGPEWLAFRTQTVAEVTTPRPVHKVPHRTNEVFRGLVNLNGQVQLCVSLQGLLGITAVPAPTRMIVLRDQERAESWAFTADAVSGIHHVSSGLWRAVPSTLANPTVGFSQGVFSWNGHSVGVLDENRVFAALRSLRA